jgi:Fe-Mn family superoxide dismutase
MAFTLPELPYAHDALEPHIDARTMEIHHGKHHAGYTKKLNAALEGHEDLQGKSIEWLLANLNDLPESVRGGVRNNGGGFSNHSLFWAGMGPGKGGAPSGALAEAINGAFGSFDDFKAKFETASKTRFGSGWGWLVVGADKGLEVTSTPNQDSPITDGKTPILGLDVWEHAYYLNYQNRRPDYITSWWDVVNWSAVAERFKNA